MEARFRPAPMRRAQTFRLEGTRLVRLDVSGAEDWALDLASVDRAVFVDFGAAKAPNRRLDLFAGGVRQRVAINAAGGLGAMREDMGAFLELCGAIFLALAEARPDLQIGLGEYGAARWALFGLGAIMVVGGGGILAAALAGGVSSSRLIDAAVPLGMLVLVGGFIAWANRPGVVGVQIAPAAMAVALKALRNR